ncbi:MAG: FAD-binding oxidoreductase [Bacteriovoracaceae bacterium]
MKLFVLLPILYSLNCSAKSSPVVIPQVNDFYSDGCSMYPDDEKIGGKTSWIHCCFVHDIAYWMGGTSEQRMDADLELKQCVSQVTSKAHGEIVFLGVRMGGGPNTKLPWRWGYGLTNYTGYRELTDQDKEAIEKKYESVLDAFKFYRPSLNESQQDYILSGIEFHKKNL